MPPGRLYYVSDSGVRNEATRLNLLESALNLPSPTKNGLLPDTLGL